MKKKQARRSSGGRAAMIALCVVLGVILTILLGATIYAQRLLNKINYVKPGEQVTLSQQEAIEEATLEQEDVDSTAPTMNDEDVQWGENTTEIGTEEHIVNILLIGQDARGNERARSDVMILCTFNKESGTLTMTSFLRDLYVQIPGYGNNKLNAAYAWGGMELLNKTLEKNFGIHVDGNVEVNFERFAKIIDILGGVEIELRSDEANYINSSVPGSRLRSGVQRLNGEQALTYSRIRKLDANADFSRTNRQRKVLNSLIQEFKNADLSTILGLLEEVLPMLTTDMTQTEIVGYTTELFPLLASAEIVSQRIPMDGAYANRKIDGRSVLVADMDAVRDFLEKTLQG